MLIRQCILPEWLRMEQSLEAYKTGDRSMLLYRVLDRPQTRSYDQAVAVLDELLDMEGHEEMDDHSSGRRIGVPTAAIPMARRTGDWEPEICLPAKTTENGTFHESRREAALAARLPANGTAQDLALAERVLESDAYPTRSCAARSTTSTTRPMAISSGCARTRSSLEVSPQKRAWHPPYPARSAHRRPPPHSR